MTRNMCYFSGYVLYTDYLILQYSTEFYCYHPHIIDEKTKTQRVSLIIHPDMQYCWPFSQEKTHRYSLWHLGRTRMLSNLKHHSRRSQLAASCHRPCIWPLVPQEGQDIWGLRICFTYALLSSRLWVSPIRNFESACCSVKMNYEWVCQ